MAASALRALPWARILLIGRILLDRFQDDVPPKDRDRLAKLLRASKGDPRKMTSAERREILAILRRVDTRRLGADIAKGVGTARLLTRRS